MKDSGIDWLGEVPEHWETVALQYICRLNSGSTITASMMEEHGRYPVYGGNINYAHGKFWASEHAIVVSPTVQIITKWMGELLRTMNLNQYSVSAAQPGLSAEFLGRLKIPFPPIEEQKAISDLIENSTKKIDQLKSKIQTAIDRLEEYRSSLITQAVTGKIDVRDTVDEVEMSYAAEEGELYKTNE